MGWGSQAGAFDIQSRMLPVFSGASRWLLAKAFCKLERWDEFDKLVSVSDAAREYILSLPATAPRGYVAQHRVRAVFE